MVKSNSNSVLIAIVIAVVAVVAIVAATSGTNDISGAALIGWTCKDSDGGMNYAVKGSIYRCSGSRCIFPIVDFCANVRTLNEYYCTNTNNIASMKYDCPQGCMSGVCTGMK